MSDIETNNENNEENNQNPKITILDKEYFFKSLPENIQKMISLFNAWKIELTKIQTESMKLELAIRGVTQDIFDTMKDIEVEKVDNVAYYTGVVKSYNDSKGFGISSIDGNDDDVILKYEDIDDPDSFKTLTEGNKIKFLIEKKNDKLYAKKIQKI